MIIWLERVDQGSWEETVHGAVVSKSKQNYSFVKEEEIEEVFERCIWIVWSKRDMDGGKRYGYISMWYCKLQQVINFALASKSVYIVHVSSLHSYFGKKKNMF